MAEKETQLSKFTNYWYQPGKNIIIRFLWYFTNVLFFINPANPVNNLKIFLLKIFGAEIGKGVVVKPGVNIKYPWKLRIGDYSWLGENVWIDNLASVQIGSNVCISQSALILTGSHDYKKTTFDLKTESVTIEKGVWIGSRSVVCPGVTCYSHSVLTVGSIATQNLQSYTVYQGNPAIKRRDRKIEDY